MTNLDTQAQQIHEQFSEHLDITIDQVKERLSTLVDEYKVPVDEARRTVVNQYLDEAGLERENVSSASSDRVSIADITSPEEWIDVTGKVVELWDPRSDAIDQVGLFGDETGTVKFTKWAKSDLSRLEEGHVYRLQNVVTDEYQGQFSIKLNRTTTIEELDEDIEVGSTDVTVTGALVDIQSGSGLIKRCPEADCTRVLQNGRCAEHGEVEGEFDLRIKGIIDDGTMVQEVLFDREGTEEIAGITLEEAKEMAMDALDTTVVADEIRDRTLGRYYEISGPRFNRYILADAAVERSGGIDPDELLIKARSVA